MHSPPPTPATNRKADVGKFAPATFAVPMSRDVSGSDTDTGAVTGKDHGSKHHPRSGTEADCLTRKRTRDQAGLATPRPTPAKQRIVPEGATAEAAGSTDRIALVVENGTAKVLFPGGRSSKPTTGAAYTSRSYQTAPAPAPDTTAGKGRPGKFDVFQDAATNTAIDVGAIDEAANPFTDAPATSLSTTSSSSSSRRGLIAPPAPRFPSMLPTTDAGTDAGTGTSAGTSNAESTGKRREDGVYYVFRGKRVFRPHATSAEKQSFDSLNPRRLFEAQLSGHVLETAFDDTLATNEHSDGRRSKDEEEIDRLEIGGEHRPSTAVRRRLF